MTYHERVRFEWDARKGVVNQRRHGVSFEAASQLFTSREGYLIFDEAHSGDEERFIAIGPIRHGIVLIVWTERDEGVIRIISARWATKHERQLYAEYTQQENGR